MRPLRGARQSLRAGMFPMLPFANCIRDNAFTIAGRHYRVAPNMAGARLNFHGSGWLSAWQPDEVTPTRAVLHLPDGRVDDIYRYEAIQTFSLDSANLLERGDYGLAAFYIVGSVGISLAALMLALWGTRLWLT